MPKIKTSSSAKKRFKMLASGKIKRSKAFRRHLLTKKNRNNKRKLRQSAYISAVDMRAIARLLPNG
jgi:large subunit ribosomal protein L35